MASSNVYAGLSRCLPFTDNVQYHSELRLRSTVTSVEHKNEAGWHHGTTQNRQQRCSHLMKAIEGHLMTHL